MSIKHRLNAGTTRTINLFCPAGWYAAIRPIPYIPVTHSAEEIDPQQSPAE
ncbi:hypothetical protein KCP77_14075 [Salmonella enterica subsp. enterica]|nr:hypothetical protein KCP77_14075 [Salmonella enterica subsp. enterica]